MNALEGFVTKKHDAALGRNWYYLPKNTWRGCLWPQKGTRDAKVQLGDSIVSISILFSFSNYFTLITQPSCSKKPSGFFCAFCASLRQQ